MTDENQTKKILKYGQMEIIFQVVKIGLAISAVIYFGIKINRIIYLLLEIWKK